MQGFTCHSLSRVVVPAMVCSVAGTTTLDREWIHVSCIKNHFILSINQTGFADIIKRIHTASVA